MFKSFKQTIVSSRIWGNQGRSAVCAELTSVVVVELHLGISHWPVTTHQHSLDPSRLSEERFGHRGKRQHSKQNVEHSHLKERERLDSAMGQARQEER